MGAAGCFSVWLYLLCYLGPELKACRASAQYKCKELCEVFKAGILGFVSIRCHPVLIVVGLQHRKTEMNCRKGGKCRQCHAAPKVLSLWRWYCRQEKRILRKVYWLGSSLAWPKFSRAMAFGHVWLNVGCGLISLSEKQADFGRNKVLY